MPFFYPLFIFNACALRAKLHIIGLRVPIFSFCIF